MRKSFLGFWCIYTCLKNPLCLIALQLKLHQHEKESILLDVQVM